MPDGAVALRLYVSGNSPKSLEAIRTIRSVCEEYLADRYNLEVVDVLTEPALSKRGGIVVTPTLLRVSPGPARMVVGNLGSRRTILYALGLLPADRPDSQVPDPDR